MGTTIPALNSVNEIQDTDYVMTTFSAGESYKIKGVKFKQYFDIIIASGTTVSGPGIHNGSTVRIYFSSALTAQNASTALVINYNNVNVTVKAPKDGSLIDYVAKAVGNDFVYCQAHTTLELLYNGTYFVIAGNPVVISNSDYTIYADGSITHKSIRIDEINGQWFIGQILHIQNIGYVINVPLSTEIIKRYNIDVVSAELSGVIDLQTYITDFSVMNNAIQVATNYPSMATYVNSQANIQLTFTMKI